MERGSADNDKMVTEIDIKHNIIVQEQTEKVYADIESVKINQVDNNPSIEEVSEPVEADQGEEELDPLNFISIKSAAQWMAVSKRISWNFDEGDKEEEVVTSDPEHFHPDAQALVVSKVTPTMTSKVVPELIHDYENVKYDIYCPDCEDTPSDFKPTK